MGRKSKRSRSAKDSRGMWPTRPSSVHPGQVIGELRCLNPDTGARRFGKRVGLWEDIKTGEHKQIINSDVVAGKTITAGRLKNARYAEYIEGAKAARYTNIEELEPDLLNDARCLAGSDVDTAGQRVAKSRIVDGRYEGEIDRTGRPRIYFLKDGILQCQSFETQGLFKRVTAEIERGGKIVEVENPMPVQRVEQSLDDKLRVLIPRLTIRHGIVTFERVRDLRCIDGRNCRDLLLEAGIIDKHLTLTEKGKAWLAQHETA